MVSEVDIGALGYHFLLSNMLLHRVRAQAMIGEIAGRCSSFGVL